MDGGASNVHTGLDQALAEGMARQDKVSVLSNKIRPVDCLPSLVFPAPSPPALIIVSIDSLRASRAHRGRPLLRWAHCPLRL